MAKLKNKKIYNYKGKVYDLTVENTHSYNIEGIGVHNSGSGSIVAYCTGITEVDPIKYGLYFERFLNPSRVSLPDFDVDFDKIRRTEVIQYLFTKYGEDKVSQIGTYSEFRPRGSLRSFARVMGEPKEVGEKLSSMIPPARQGKSLTFDESIEVSPELLTSGYDDVVRIARQAEGLKFQPGIHAAGVVIANSDISKIIPLFRGKHDEIAAQFDMHDVEEVGLVKYDFLGLKNLTVIQETIELVKKYKDIDINIATINVDDQEVYKNIFQKGKIEGIFQFENSSGFRDLCLQVKPRSIEDLSAITSLWRPGPISCGATSQYVDNRKGGNPQLLLQQLEPILERTAGVLVYQEQVMRICRDLAGYTLAEADNMRKIIGKKLLDKMKLEKEKFVGGCVSNNINIDKAKELFDQIEGFAAYSFNLAHAIAYSIISYRTAWLKHYYPHEYYAALLNSSLKDQDDIVKYIHACREDGISIYPPDINKSEAGFGVDNKTLLFGLTGIKGIGVKAVEPVLEERRNNGYFLSLKDMSDRGVHKGIFRSFAKSGALEDILEIERDVFIENIEDVLKYYAKHKKYIERQESIKAREEEIRLTVEAGKKPPRRKPADNRGEPEYPELREAQAESPDRLAFEKETLGFYITGHPLDKYFEYYGESKTTLAAIKSGEMSHKKKIKLPVVIYSIEEKRTKKGDNMAAIIIEDRTSRAEVMCFPRQWARFKKSIKEDAVVLLGVNIKTSLSDDEKETPIVKISFESISEIQEPEDVKMAEDITVSLKDGTQFTFVLSDNTDVNKCKEAYSIAKNLERI